MRYHAVLPTLARFGRPAGATRAPSRLATSRGKTALVLRVAARTIVLYWCVLSLTFALLRLAPGDPATFLLDPGASAADAVRLRTELGLDRPMAVQYARWLGATLRGDLGTSFVERRPVSAALADALPVSLALGATSLL